VKIKIQLLPIKMHPLFPSQDARRQGTLWQELAQITKILELALNKQI
jgi:hypothetical protein